MKRISLLAIILTITLMLSACVTLPSRQSQNQSQDSEPPSAQGSTGNAASPEASASAQQSEKPSKVSVNEQVLLEENDVKITLKSLETEDVWYGPELKILIENESDTGITVQTRNSAINGVMMDTLISCDVQPGKKANDEISISQNDLDRAGISTIKDIEFTFHVCESESWSTIFDSGTVYITTTADPGYTQKYNDSGDLLYSKDGIKVVYQTVDYSDSYWGAEVYMYIENLTSNNIMVQVKDESVNGFMVSSIFSCEVMHGKRAYDAIIITQSEMDDNGIVTFDEMEFYLDIFDIDSWDTIDYSDKITINFD